MCTIGRRFQKKVQHAKSQSKHVVVCMKYRKKLKLFRFRSGVTNSSNPEMLQTDVESDKSESFEYIVHNKEIGPELCFHWEETSDVRLNKLVETNGKVSDYLSQYPVLAEPSGYTFLELDFVQRFKVKETDIYKKWQNFHEKPLSLASVHQKKTIDDHIQSLKKDIPAYYRILLQIWMLPYLVLPRTRKTL
ncbi:uncharacterized protein LOC107046148 [Diachasma alloeum]|uniref:uncharacterized protein LOC107046148 n=1 Tax=Diachasma alloeum TaxID=454923 RepID=UPI00073814E6|nr:uncharacterized protein LOC107046148 [Diachasma alloeum]